MDFGALVAIGKIIAFDLILSGDNAVVIGMAANRLSPENRRRAIIIGGAGAVILRIIFTALVSLLLDVPLLQAAGGLLLIWIAYKLVKPHGHDEANVQSADTLMQAIQTIIVADAVMSLDNMLAVGAAAEGHLWLLLFGLGLSIPILLFGSALIAQLLGRYPILMWVGVIILLHTAVHMFFGDSYVEDALGHANQAMVWTVAIALSVLFYIVVRLRYGRQASPREVVPTP
ncbi:MAG TPA: YjbE family putative metal transport protein [Thermomicrobiales bacterium]|nr:YjbE family putative metal transport protein [Thermomicrobiales bacterium]